MRLRSFESVTEISLPPCIFSFSHSIFCLSTSKRARSAVGRVCGAGRRSSSSMRPPAGTGETRRPMQSHLCWITSGISWEIGCGGRERRVQQPPNPQTHPPSPPMKVVSFMQRRLCIGRQVPLLSTPNLFTAVSSYRSCWSFDPFFPKIVQNVEVYPFFPKIVQNVEVLTLFSPKLHRMLSFDPLFPKIVQNVEVLTLFPPKLYRMLKFWPFFPQNCTECWSFDLFSPNLYRTFKFWPFFPQNCSECWSFDLFPPIVQNVEV